MSYASTTSFYPYQIPLPASSTGISGGYDSGYDSSLATPSQQTLPSRIQTLLTEVLTALSEFETANSSSQTGGTPLSGAPTISSLQTGISGYTDPSLESPRARRDAQMGAFDATANPSYQQAIELVREMRLEWDAVEARCRSYLEDPAQGAVHGFGEADKARGALNDPAFWLYLARTRRQLATRLKRRFNGQWADRFIVADLSARVWTIIRGLPQDDAGSLASSVAPTEPSLPAGPSLQGVDLASPPSAVIPDREQKLEVQQEDDTFSALPFPGNGDEVDDAYDAARNGLGDDHPDDQDPIDDNDRMFDDVDDGAARA